MRNANEKEIEALKDYLQTYCIGKENKITSWKLQELGFGKPVKIRMKVHTLRLNGEPICSNNSGYWYAENEEELKETIKFIHSMWSDIHKVLVALKKTYFDMGGTEL